MDDLSYSQLAAIDAIKRNVRAASVVQRKLSALSGDELLGRFSVAAGYEIERTIDAVIADLIRDYNAS